MTPEGRLVVISRRWFECDATRVMVRQFSPTGALLQEWEDLRLLSNQQALLPPVGSDLALCVFSDGLRAQHNDQLLDLRR